MARVRGLEAFKSSHLWTPTGSRGVFGGQVIAQSIMAACKTVEDKDLHSQHVSWSWSWSWSWRAGYTAGCGGSKGEGGREGYLWLEEARWGAETGDGLLDGDDDPGSMCASRYRETIRDTH
jgi:hypothetical protein